MDKVKYIVPVASGKGGVGKSTVSANLAVALAGEGARVGLMDADVYGPSIPMLMGAQGAPDKGPTGKMAPLVCHGVRIISTGFFVPKGEAVIWRGPMLHKMIGDFLEAVDWGELDYLIVDLPPGTGDVQLSLCQRIPVTGAVIVSTPQDLAFSVAAKAIAMFAKLRTPVLGMIENMSGYECSQCGHHEEIFGRGGARCQGDERKIPFLGAIPLATDIRTASDAGDPIVHQAPDSAAAQSFVRITHELIQRLKEDDKTKEAQGPQPTEVSQPDQHTVQIRWSDGRTSNYKAHALRVACSCAQCVDEVSGKRLISAGSIKKNVHPVKIGRVGAYGLRFNWSDGHSAGIYTFDALRSMS